MTVITTLILIFITITERTDLLGYILLLGGILIILIVGYFLFNKLEREESVKIDDRPLIHLRGLLRGRITGNAGAQLFIQNYRVCVPVTWAKIWFAPVDVLAYPTESGRYLIVKLTYVDEEGQRESMKEAGRSHFSLDDDVKTGKIEMGKDYYILM
jgi:hypothetical protein